MLFFMFNFLLLRKYKSNELTITIYDYFLLYIAIPEENKNFFKKVG